MQHCRCLLSSRAFASAPGMSDRDISCRVGGRRTFQDAPGPSPNPSGREAQPPNPRRYPRHSVGHHILQSLSAELPNRHRGREGSRSRSPSDSIDQSCLDLLCNRSSTLCMDRSTPALYWRCPWRPARAFSNVTVFGNCTSLQMRQTRRRKAARAYKYGMLFPT